MWLLLLLLILPGSLSFALWPTGLTRSSFQTRLIPESTSSRVIHCKPSAAPLYSSPNDTAQTNQESSNQTKTSSSRRRINKPKKDLYAILGANPSMPKSEIKRLYISLAKQTHPDSPNYNADNADFSEIASAYKILSDDKERRRYDREVAAEEFKGDVVAYASEVAKEYGPVARKFYEDWALPFLKRTTASTVAVISEVTSENNVNRNGYNNHDYDGEIYQMERTRTIGSSRRGTQLENGATLSEVVSEMTQLERQSNGNRALEDFGKAFQRVIEAGRNATRQIDGAELQEKSMELRLRADEARAESLAILDQLSAIKAERLRLTFYTSNAEFSSAEALQFLDEFDTEENGNEKGIMGKIGLKHTIREDIEMFGVAEAEFQNRMQDKTDVEAEAAAMERELKKAEQDAMDAEKELNEARRRLAEARQQLTQSQSRVTEILREISNTNLSFKRASQEVARSDQNLKRKRDVVRRSLKRKDETYREPMNVFDSADDGGRLNSAYDKSFQMNNVDVESQNLAQIELLKKQEANIESEFLMLVEKASRLVSRSERLRLRSEALLGNQNGDTTRQSFASNNGQRENVTNGRGTVIGDSLGETAP